MAEEAAVGAELAMPAEEELHAAIREILAVSDLTKMSLKEVRTELAHRFRLPPGSMDRCKELIKVITAKEIDRLQANGEGDGDGADDAQAEAEPEAEVDRATPTKQVSKAKAKAKTKAKAAAAEKQTGSSGSQKRPRESAGGSEEKPARGPGSKARQASAMSRKEFMEVAKDFQVTIGDRTIKVPSKLFSTGSCGFYGSSKVTMTVGDTPLCLQCSINCTVIGSKQWSD